MKFLFSLLICLTIFFNSCFSQKSISSISNLISKYQNDRTGNFKRYTFNEIRQKFFKKYPDLISSVPDTLFLLEMYDVEKNGYYGSMINKKDTINFNYLNSEFMLIENPRFSTTALQMVLNWDTATIRKEELKYPNSKRTISASRYIENKKLPIVSTLAFKELVF